MNSNMMQHRVKTLFNTFMANPNFKIKKLPYVHVKLLPQSDWATVMRQYIHKAMTP